MQKTSILSRIKQSSPSDVPCATRASTRTTSTRGERQPAEAEYGEMNRTNMNVALRGYADSMTSVKNRVSPVHVAPTSRRLNGHTTGAPSLPHQRSLMMHTTEKRMMTLSPSGMTAMEFFAHGMKHSLTLFRAPIGANCLQSKQHRFLWS